MLVIPDATIHTLMQLMEDGRPFKSYMKALDGSARFFFEKEFFDPSFAATKKQILKRLWGVLSTPAFERMFAQKANKLDLFQAINDGKIILVSTAKDLLKTEGSQLFGRFFIALLKQAALERSTVAADKRTPTFVYVDEAQEYFDESIETILNQARKYGLSLTLAHQALDQLSPRLRSVLASNTSMKCAGGVSAKDARALADDLHTSVDFIESMRRRGGRTEFAVWVSLLVSTLGLAAFTRAETTVRQPFFIYVDEFQTFTTLAFANLMSELRKYGVGLTLAHQHLAQLEPEIRHAVLGNAATVIAFRLGAEDAPYFAKEFQPTFDVEDLLNLPNQHIYLKLMIDGTPSRPFSATVLDITRP